MKSIILIISLMLALNFADASAAQIKGKVSGVDENGNSIPLNKATIIWQGTTKGTLSDKNGNFELQRIKESNAIIISYVGYKTDTIKVDSNKDFVEISLKSGFETDEVKVVADAPAQTISKASTVNTVTITERGLQKAACCNLAESFVTNAAAEVEYSDALSGARQIKLLGLKGTYTQLLFENLPSMRGLATSFGLGYLPGPWMESISVSKGTSSVVNGFESITGQINVEMKKPEHNEPTHLNFYGDHLGRVEGNSYGTYKINDNLSTMMLMHASTHQMYHDLNNDNFIDHPAFTVANVVNRWKYHGEDMESVNGVHFVYEDRKAGQRDFIFDRNPNSYGMDIQTTRVNLFTKNGFFFSPESKSSIGTIVSFTHHNQKSFYGINNFDAQQNSFYTNLLYSKEFDGIAEEHNHDHGEEESSEVEVPIWHKLTTGFSFQYDNYFHTLNSQYNIINELVPGVFAEYSFIGIKDLVITSGLRVDNHNIYGAFVTPRFHVKYNPDEFTTFRLSAGKGSRTPYAIAENSFVLASSRQIEFLDDLEREEAAAFGASVTSEFEVAGIYFTFNTDFYHTQFINQLIVDMDRSTRHIYFYNLEGESFSNSLQVDLIAELTENFTVTTAYRFNEVKMTFNGELMDKPFQSFHKGFLNLAYNTDANDWSVDFTVEYNGSGRIPATHHNPSEYRLPERFDPFAMYHAHITKRFEKFEIYLGAENLFDFVQGNPILAANDPFGNYFDSSMIWGPVIGRKVYIGARYNIK